MNNSLLKNGEGVKKMKNKNLIFTILLMAAIGGLGFYGGMRYQKSKGVSFAPGQFRNGSARPSGAASRNGFFQGGRPVSGEIVSIENNNITLKTQDGNSKIIFYSDSTKVNKTSAGSKEDLKVGEQATVIGSEGTDGTVTAQTISVGGNILTGVPNEQPPSQGN